MTYGIDRPHSGRKSTSIKRGSDVPFFSDSFAALHAFGGNAKNKIDDFRYESDGTIYGPYDLATSFPYLSHAVSVVCGEILDDETMAYDRYTAAYASEILNLHRNEYVRELRDDLRSGTYVRREPRTAKIPKMKYRDDIPLDIAAIWSADEKDLLKSSSFVNADRVRGDLATRTIVEDAIAHRVACRAMNTVALTVASPRMGAGVIGCMPGIGMPEIIKGVRAATVTSKRDIALCFDISGFYDNVLVGRAMTYTRGMLGYDPRSRFGSEFERFALGDIPAPRGLPQGNVLSPLVANIYATEAIDPEARNWGPYFRYVDDGLVLCHSFGHADDAYVAIAKRAEGFGLTLHARKTEIVDLRTSERRVPLPFKTPRSA